MPTNARRLIELIGVLLVNGQSDRAAPWVAMALRKYPDDPIILGLAVARRSRPLASTTPWRWPIGRSSVTLETPTPCWLACGPRSSGRNGSRPCPTRNAQAEVAPNDPGALQMLHLIETRLGLTRRTAATLIKLNQAQVRMNAMNELSLDIAQSR